jgi:hypothetical protein
MVKIHKDKVEKVDMVKKCAIFYCFWENQVFSKVSFFAIVIFKRLNVPIL